MRPYSRTLKLLFACLCVTFFIMVMLDISPLTPKYNCPEPLPQPKDEVPVQVRTEITLHSTYSSNVHSLCIIVPFKDRLEELLEFAPQINEFLNKQDVKHKIFVINQVDSHRFNRASLINVGFLETANHCDYIAMHDVDLIPLNPELIYSYPEKGPLHLAAPNLHPRYHYATFVGGILLLRRDHFQLVNGLSNRYWGWGLEDDEFYYRMITAGLNITRPMNISTGTHNTFIHLHDKRRRRDTAKLFNQKEVTRRRDRVTGLNTVKYKVLQKYNMMIEGVPVYLINVELICDYKQTPWCDHAIVDNLSSKKTVINSAKKTKT